MMAKVKARPRVATIEQHPDGSWCVFVYEKQLGRGGHTYNVIVDVLNELSEHQATWIRQNIR